MGEEWLRNSDALNFFKQLEFPKKRLKLRKLENGVSIVGVATKIKIDYIKQILLDNNVQGKNVFKIQKLFKNKILFTSEICQKNKKTESFFVKYKYGSDLCFGSIYYFIRITNCKCNNICSCSGKNLAIVKKCNVSNPFSVNLGTLSFIHKCIIDPTSIIAIDVI